MTESAETTIQNLPCWQGDITVEPLEGGITNLNFKVVDDHDGAQYVVRLGDDIPVHHIYRDKEIAVAKAAFTVGISPAVRYVESGVLVMDYIPSRTLEPSDFHNRDTLANVVTLIKRCHSEIPLHLRGAAPLFWVFQVARDYAASLVEGESRHVDKLPDLLTAVDQLEQAAGPFDMVFGHNDLLAANLLDDGDRLWLIDWEYAGFNTPLFDLGGVASNNELDEADERWLLDAYFETAVTDDLWKRYQAMKTASLLRETLWSMISELHSSIDFDYAQYTRDNLSRYDLSYREFQTLL